ncbi:replicase polyprotein 1a [Plakobranchus ocellatus]|uniref:Replicase polyprotein 1a n=1 Tax=Plakobranchus ocellatus TaxID=259542 RepID=A0AAV4A7X4_9GAST|nr:replicase polyprotein 1a [Plakobranchus ocellatus]
MFDFMITYLYDRKVLRDLPSEALQVCLDVHPTFAILIREKCFLNAHLRQELQLEDDDVAFDTFPTAISPLLELWYFTNSAASRRRNADKSGPMLKRDSLFFPLVCFKHSLHTWLVQSGGLDLSSSGSNNNNITSNNSTGTAASDCICTNVCNSNNWPVSTMPQEAGVGPGALVEACDLLLDQRMASLPPFVLTVLTKLSLALPDFLERTLYTQHLTLHQGCPVTLAHTWEVFIQPLLRLRKFSPDFKPLYSLEVVFGQTMVEESTLRLNAMLILFAHEEWVLWIGTVAPFPACKHGSTLTLKATDVACSINMLSKCVSDIAGVFDTAPGMESVSHRWMLQKLFPGVCHMLHAQARQNLVMLLNSRIELLANNINSYTANRHPSLAGQTKSEHGFHSKLNTALHPLGLDLNNCQTLTNTQKRFLQDELQRKTGHSSSNVRSENIAQGLQSALQGLFSSEVRFFISNAKTHILLCRTFDDGDDGYGNGVDGDDGYENNVDGDDGYENNVDGDDGYGNGVDGDAGYNDNGVDGGDDDDNTDVDGGDDDDNTDVDGGDDDYDNAVDGDDDDTDMDGDDDYANGINGDDDDNYMGCDNDDDYDDSGRDRLILISWRWS